MLPERLFSKARDLYKNILPQNAKPSIVLGDLIPSRVVLDANTARGSHAKALARLKLVPQAT